MEQFRIYYGDGSTFEGRPEDAPADNVQAIAWDDPTGDSESIGRVVLREWDIYIYSEDIGWHGTDKWSDLRFHLSKRPCLVRSVLFGGWIERDAFRKLIRQAETEGAPKSAIDPIREDGSP